MKELAQVRGAVLEALREAGLPALEAFPDSGAKAYSGPVAAVSVGALEGKSTGFCNYLGEVFDESAGTARELYGKQLDGEIRIDIRADRAADCETGCEQAAETLLGGLPSGIRPGELYWEALTWEKATGMFLRQGRLRCQAIFVAEGNEDGQTFLDFVLKGVMKK